MEIEKVRELLVKIALDHGQPPMKTEDALRNIANALLHVAEAVNDIQRRLPTRAEYF